MAADLLMIVPSRGRPGNVAALVDAWFGTAVGAATLLIAIDDDDPTRDDYLKMLAPPIKAGTLRVEVAKRQRLGGTLNSIAGVGATEYRALGFMGDDHRPRTAGWDRRMVEALDELGSGMVYGDDLFQRANLPTAIAMTSDIVRSLGYMVPGGLVHLYVDDAWKALGEGIGRLRYLPDVVIEHLHPSAGKAQMDASYEETNSQAQFDADRQRFEDWQQSGLDADVTKLRELIARG